MNQPVLKASGVRKNYPSGDRVIEVLRGVDLEVRAGETVSVRGESGSGKSTLLNLFAGLDKVDGGEVLWEGVATIDAATRGRLLGIVFQSFYLIPEIDALSNILMARRIAGALDAKARASHCLSRWASASAATIFPPSFRAASASASPWRGP